MSDHPTIEQDLRSALRSVAPEDLDATDFRARLDQVLTGQDDSPVPDPADEREADVLPLQPVERPRRSRTSRFALIATVAACAAAVIALVLAVLPSGHSDRHHTRPAAHLTAPAPIRSILLPGTILLHNYSGHGSQTFALPHRVIPKHFSYATYGTCSGPGSLTIAKQTLIGVCRLADDGGVFGSSFTLDRDQRGRLVIKASPAMTWQITLVFAPDSRTNGSLQSPVDTGLTAPNSLVRHDGHGTATVTFPGVALRSTRRFPYSLALVCHGAGVAIPDVTAQRVKSLYTKTCFAGQEYVWNNVSLATPNVLHVQAAPGTTWSIEIN